MVKRNGETVEYQVALNIPHLRKKINKTCANRPLSCVNGENPSDFGSDKETVYRCVAALGRRACPLSLASLASSPRGGASGVSVRPMLDEQSFFILKTAVPCYRGQQLRNNILVKLLLISVAGHSFLRYIRLPAVSSELPGLPKPLLQGEVARRRRDGEVKKQHKRGKKYVLCDRLYRA